MAYLVFLCLLLLLEGVVHVKVRGPLWYHLRLRDHLGLLYQHLLCGHWVGVGELVIGQRWSVLRLRAEPTLRDQACLKRFADDPAYLAMVRDFDERRAILRDRLPATLAQYGVSL